MKIEMARTLPATRRECFAALLDIARWPAWTPFRPVGGDEALAHPGDEIVVSYRHLGIPLQGRIMLEDAAEPEVVRLLVMFPGVPNVHQTMSLRAAGTKATVVTVALLARSPRNRATAGLRRIALSPRLVRRDLRRGLDRLHDLMLATGHDAEIVG